MRFLRHSFIMKVIAVLSAIQILNTTIYPSIVMALTSGPSQPEVAGFTPAEVTEMVDLFTGDFNYNVPLFTIGDYPINLSYSSNLTTDMESSWVGLGWSLNPGIINRDMRGLPDEFDGDLVVKEENRIDNKTMSLTGSLSVEALGADLPVGGGFDLTVTHNTFSGYSIDLGMNCHVSPFAKHPKMGLGADLSMGTNGMSISPSVSYSIIDKDKFNLGASLGASYSSRKGLKSTSFGVSAKIVGYKYDKYLLGRNTSIGRRVYELNQSGFGTSSGSSIGFCDYTITPKASNTYKNSSFSFDVKVGADVFGVFGSAGLKASFASQSIENRIRNYNAYGYSNLQNINQDMGDYLIDFNRENYSNKGRSVPRMYSSSLTYDRFTVMAQGAGGSFRLKRSDVGIISDPYVEDIQASVEDESVSGEIAFPASSALRLGGNYAWSNVESHTGVWNEENDWIDYFGFEGKQDGDDYEPSYFVKEGDINAETDEQFYNRLGGFDAIAPVVTENHVVENQYRNNNGEIEDLSWSGYLKRSEREVRKEILQPIRVFERNFCEEANINVYNENLFEEGSGFLLQDIVSQTNGQIVINSQSTIQRDVYPTHHYTALHYQNMSGRRFNYEIPAYNNLKKESIFSVSSLPSTSDTKGLVSFTSTENSIGNVSGSDHYYSANIVDPYPYAFLLTSVLSSDYSDVDGVAGPSDGDNGNYVKFDYTKIDNFKWRAPYKQANHNKGMYSKTHDDKGSFVYGEKDLWYLKIIESKDQIAVFFLGDDRLDGFEADSENALTGCSVNDENLRKLDSIQIFNKNELINVNALEDAVPVKTVVFKYDYSLCSGVYNNLTGSGKLTLKEVYFKYGKSGQGRQSPYIFNYNEVDENPNYHPRAYDRWGNYSSPIAKDNNGDGNFDSNNDLTSEEFPYTSQELCQDAEFDYLADKYANSWLLNEIQVPSGAIINVEYEADDYAYVQNKKAMQMAEVVGFADCQGDIASYVAGLEAGDIVNELYTDYSNSNNYLVVKLPELISYDDYYSSGVFDVNRFTRDVLCDENGQIIEDFYYRFYLNLEDSKYEFVSGYLELEPFTGNGTSLPHYATSNGTLYLKIKKVVIQGYINNELINPITQRGISFCKKYYPEAVYEFEDPNDDEPGDFLVAMASIISGPLNDLIGRGKKMISDNKCNTFNANRSWVRVYNPLGIKKGGGVRVAQVSMSDNWADMTSTQGVGPETSMNYGFTYDYKKLEGGKLISSGVASYEPINGGDENPFRKPLAYERRYILAANESDYIEGPTGEAFYPNPVVGYSKVTVKPISNPNVRESASGYSVYEYYTSKDFPTRMKLVKKREERKPHVLNNFNVFGSGVSSNNFTEYMGVSIIKNDMHGKLKCECQYKNDTDVSGNPNILSQKEYNYRLDEEGNLSPYALAFNYETNAISEKMFGISHDVTIDMEESRSKIKNFNTELNLELFFVPFTIPIPTPFFSLFVVKDNYRGGMVTKIINQNGLLESIKVTHEGSVVKSNNLLLDYYTGQTLITESENEFEDNYYTFNYPAFWMYKQMGLAYNGIGFSVEVSSIDGSGTASLPAASVEKFTPGDEVLIATNGGYYKRWVNYVGNDNIQIIDRNGDPIGPITQNPSTITILKSGRDNNLTALAGNVILNSNPLHENAGQYSLNFNSVINASAVEFSDDAYQNCNCRNDSIGVFNEWLAGTKGFWKPYKNYYYMDMRKQSSGSGTNLRDANYNTNIREDGVFEGDFLEFWKYNSGAWEKNESGTAGGTSFNERWNAASEVTKFSIRGMELENKDAMDVFSSAVFGYNGLLPLIVAKNAMLKQIGYDGFEDYNTDPCTKDHFSFENENIQISDEESHTGNHSIKLNPSSSVEITKEY